MWSFLVANATLRYMSNAQHLQVGRKAEAIENYVGFW